MSYDQPSAYVLFPKHIVIAGHFNEPDTYICKRPEGMQDWLITYTLDGEGFIRTPQVERTCKSGDVALLKSGTPHEYGTAPGKIWHFFWVHFTERSLESDLLPADPLWIDSMESESTRKRIGDAFNRILLEYRDRNGLWQELCMNALQEILLLLLQRRMRKVDPRTDDVLHILSTRLSEPLSIDAIARTVGLSPSRLSHIFKQDTGVSIIDRLNHMRIRQAALMLKHTNRRPTEVCHDVGFHNYNHFIKQFRKYYQVTPSEYKKMQ
jgi:AraC family transcriptional regulator of arabinose operon